MAGVRQQDIDKDTGIVISGPYAGHHIDEVMEFLENKAAGISGNGSPARGETTETTPSAERTPEQKLDDAVKARTGGLEQAVMAQNARLEGDDETKFAATVPDYDTVFRDTKKTIRQHIAELKKTLNPAQRIAVGIHRQLYMMVKQQDPVIQARIFGTEPPAAETEETTEETAEETTEETPPPTPAPKPVVKKPTAVSAPPTAPNRSKASVPSSKGSKLNGNAKTEAAARSFGMSHDDYLKRLEENGTSQDSLDSMTINRKVAGTPGRRTTVFDRV